MTAGNVREWDHYVTYTLRSGQQGHIVLRTPVNPSDRLLRSELAHYGLDPADIKKVSWQPVPSVRQSAVFQSVAPIGSAPDAGTPPQSPAPGQPMPAHNPHAVHLARSSRLALKSHPIVDKKRGNPAELLIKLVMALLFLFGVVVQIFFS